jgi:hypothetical protein
LPATGLAVSGAGFVMAAVVLAVLLTSAFVVAEGSDEQTVRSNFLLMREMRLEIGHAVSAAAFVETATNPNPVGGAVFVEATGRGETAVDTTLIAHTRSEVGLPTTEAIVRRRHNTFILHTQR